VTRAAIVLACLLALVGAGNLAASPGKRASPALGVTWGTHHFTTRSALASWLSRRGIRYEDWLLRHPGGGYLMSHSAPAVSASGDRAPTHGHSTLGITERTLYVLALLLFLIAAIPVGMIGRIVPHEYLARIRSIRMMVAGGALSIAVGSALASFL
jgi:hypothetical protein